MRPLPNTFFVQTANATVANTTTETTILGTGTGTKTLPANFLTVGKVIRVRARGYYSTSGTSPTLRFEMNLGTALGDTGAITTGANLTNAFWQADFDIVCRTTGASGTVMLIGSVRHRGGPADETQLCWPIMNTGGAITIDTTAAQAVDLKIQWGSASASNTITSAVSVLEAAEAM